MQSIRGRAKGGQDQKSAHAVQSEQEPPPTPSEFKLLSFKAQ